jgi:hypothetical protein
VLLDVNEIPTNASFVGGRVCVATKQRDWQKAKAVLAV